MSTSPAAPDANRIRLANMLVDAFNSQLVAEARELGMDIEVRERGQVAA